MASESQAIRSGRSGVAAAMARKPIPMVRTAPTARARVRCSSASRLASSQSPSDASTVAASARHEFRAGLTIPALNSWRADAATVLASLGDWDAARRLAAEHLTLARAVGAVRAIGIGLRAMAAGTPDLPGRHAWLSEAI